MSTRNMLYVKFKQLIGEVSINGDNFRHHIENLNKFLYRAEIKPDKLKYCSLEHVLVKYTDKDNIEAYQSIFEKVELKVDGTRKSGYEQCIQLNTKYLILDIHIVFAGIFEVIYTVRNTLVHGKMNPADDEHNVAKYCYLILWNLMA